MTNKLKCPFCGKKLFYDEQDGIYRCMKFGCVMDYEGGTEQLWQALIHTKKQFDRAKWWLKEIVENHRYTPITTAEMALKELDDEQ